MGATQLAWHLGHRPGFSGWPCEPGTCSSSPQVHRGLLIFCGLGRPGPRWGSPRRGGPKTRRGGPEARRRPRIWEGGPWLRRGRPRDRGFGGEPKKGDLGPRMGRSRAQEEWGRDPGGRNPAPSTQHPAPSIGWSRTRRHRYCVWLPTFPDPSPAPTPSTQPGGLWRCTVPFFPPASGVGVGATKCWGRVTSKLTLCHMLGL